MSSEKKVFLIGPGLIGADLLELLLDDGYEVTTMVRREEHAAQIREFGTNVKVIMGTLDDKDIITKHTAEVPIVIHAATADHLPSVEAVIDGIRQRADKSQSTIFIHTSGTSELVDNSKGMYASEKIYTDKDPADVDANVPDTAPHREIDLAILKARKELGTKAKIVIILPPLIYGVGRRIKRLTIQLPTMTRFALKHGYVPVIGKGVSIRCNIHVQDLVRGYMIILHWMEKASASEVLENPYFFTDSGEEMTWGDGAREIGKALYAAGRIKDPEPRNPPKELYGDLFGPFSPTTVGANSRSRGERLREMGWKPREKSVFASLREDEIPIILEEWTGEFHGYEGVASSGTHVLESLKD
jgi:nucleoside-diphosphate-sugar epimerase